MLRVARTIPSDSGAEYDDYQRMGNLVENIVEQLKTVDPSIQISFNFFLACGEKVTSDDL